MGFTHRFHEDETGAETVEIVLALVCFVVGVIIAYHILSDVLNGQMSIATDCIENAAEEQC